MIFQALHLDQMVERKTFREASLPLREALLQSQFALNAAGKRVLIIVSGVPGAGRGNLVHRLNEWFDARGVNTVAFWDHSDEEEERPYRWRFWRSLPPRGRIAVFFGSWYSQSLRARTLGKLDDNAFDAELHRITDLEKMLSDDGLLIIKLWLHISKDRQREQIEQRLASEQLNRILPQDYGALTERYDSLLTAAERMITQTDRSLANWHLIESHDAYHRDLSAGQHILQRIRAILDTNTPPAMPEKAPDSSAKTTGKVQRSESIARIPATILDTLDLSQSVKSDIYSERLKQLQQRLGELAWSARESKQSLVLVFEGWDAAGKGSAIRRVAQSMDPRLFTLSQVAAPTDEERSHHYLWRFWRSLARDGRMMIFDRSWYGRVLVERVEGLTAEAAWQRSYAEINHFEDELRRHHWTVVKFFLHISPKEQWIRFEERHNTPHKHYKITDDDWRNREKWPAYAAAIDEMVRRTSTEHAPWTLVPANDKRFARLTVLETVCEQLASAIEKQVAGRTPAPGAIRVLT
jgi:AMP-polyphosphate phosphotransferase